MKKIININLSGRVIPIEDAAYESLKQYIESLRRYFAQEEGRDEIISDIEGRIAELMHDKVKKGAPAITEADMEVILNTMGRVEDFEQADAAESGAAAGTTTAEEASPFSRVTGMKPRGRMYRDSNDKIIGGVAAGVANYFGIDPAIVRIILVLLVFGGGSGILLYLLLWIFLPKKPLEPTVAKRFFRNPEDRIIGGVAGGLAAYFNKDAWTIRLIFLAPILLNLFFELLQAIFSTFGNYGFHGVFVGSFSFTFGMAYIILWIILPEARTPFQKMEMRGENVDVHRIRENVKSEMENLKTRAQNFGEEVKTSARDFGERAGAQGRAFAGEVSETARPVARTIGSIIAFLVKAFVVFIVGVVAFAFFVALIALIFSGVGDIVNSFLLESNTQAFLGWTGFLLLFGVPFVAIITWIVRRLMRVRQHNRYIGWTFAALWLLGLFFAGFFTGSVINNFRVAGKNTQDVPVTAAFNRMLVQVNEPAIEYSGHYSFIDNEHDERGWDVTGDSLKLSNVKLLIEKSTDSHYHVRVERVSQGRDRRQAQRLAELIDYKVSAQDSILNLGSGFGVSSKDKFRNQRVIVRIQVPVGKQIRFDQTVEDRLNPMQIHINNNGRWNRSWETDWDDDYGSDYSWRAGIDYVMEADGKLTDVALGRRPDSRNDNGVYEYGRNNTAAPNTDSLQRAIEEKERSLREDQRRLYELQRQRQEQPAPEAPRAPAPEARLELEPKNFATMSLVM